MSGVAVVGVKRLPQEKEWAEHAALGGSAVHHYSGIVLRFALRATCSHSTSACWGSE